MGYARKKRTESRTGGRRTAPARTVFVAAVAVAAVATVAWWALSRETGVGKGPDADESASVLAEKLEGNDRDKTPRAESGENHGETRTAEKPGGNASGGAPEWKPYSNIKPPNVPEGEAWVPGRPKVHDIEYVIANADAKPVHRNVLEQNLINIFTCELGDAPRPLGPTDFKDRAALLGILVSPNPVTDEDSETVKVAKETLALAKKEMARYMADGGDPELFLQHSREILLKAWKKRQDAQDIVRDILEKDGDEELARSFVKRINAEFEAEGIKRIYLPARAK